MKPIRSLTYILIAVAILVAGLALEKKLNEYRTALDIHTERILEMREGREVNFAELKKQCKDIKGWIYLADTNIDYPVVQGEDNDFYLYHDIDGSYRPEGSLFIDAAVEEPFKSFNTIVYGHHMKSGAMLANLIKYRDREFFDSHKTIIIETEDASYDLHVIAICEEMSDSKLYTTGFDEPVYSEEDGDDEIEYVKMMTRSEFVDLVKEKAVYVSEESFDENDTYVTLSTCVFATGEERIQVIGILKDAPLEEKTVEVKTEKPLVNKWLLWQVFTGAVVLLALILLLKPKSKRK